MQEKIREIKALDIKYEFDNKETKEKKEKKCKHKWKSAGGITGCWNYVVLYCEKCGEAKKSPFNYEKRN